MALDLDQALHELLGPFVEHCKLIGEGGAKSPSDVADSECRRATGLASCSLLMAHLRQCRCDQGDPIVKMLRIYLGLGSLSDLTDEEQIQMAMRESLFDEAPVSPPPPPPPPPLPPPKPLVRTNSEEEQFQLETAIALSQTDVRYAPSPTFATFSQSRPSGAVSGAASSSSGSAAAAASSSFFAQLERGASAAASSEAQLHADFLSGLNAASAAVAASPAAQRAQAMVAEALALKQNGGTVGTSVSSSSSVAPNPVPLRMASSQPPDIDNVRLGGFLAVALLS